MERTIDRFDAYMASAGLNDNKVTVQLGLTVGLIGKSRKPGRDLSRAAITKILDYYTDLNSVWLLTGEGSMLVDQPQPEVEPSMQEQVALENSLIAYLQKKIAELESKVDKLNDEKAELLQENAVLKYENMIMSPRKGDAEGAGDSLSASAI
jgi:hypothetical protein